jgi:hypothetical protein
MRKPKSLKINLKHINDIHHGTHSVNLATNTFPLTKGHCHQIQHKIKTDVLNVMNPIGNLSISAMEKNYSL